MVEPIKSWVKENQALVFFLIAQTIAITSGLAYIVNWKADLESRVHILETRGSSHLAEINNRLTVTEKETEGNQKRIDRVVEIMLRELPIKSQDLRSLTPRQ
jgi:hypothetical protein